MHDLLLSALARNIIWRIHKKKYFLSFPRKEKTIKSRKYIKSEVSSTRLSQTWNQRINENKISTAIVVFIQRHVTPLKSSYSRNLSYCSFSDKRTTLTMHLEQSAIKTSKNKLYYMNKGIAIKVKIKETLLAGKQQEGGHKMENKKFRADQK